MRECCILSLSPQPRTCCSQRQCTGAQEHGPDLVTGLDHQCGAPQLGGLREASHSASVSPFFLSLHGANHCPRGCFRTQRGDVGRGWVHGGPARAWSVNADGKALPSFSSNQCQARTMCLAAELDIRLKVFQQAALGSAQRWLLLPTFVWG